MEPLDPIRGEITEIVGGPSSGRTSHLLACLCDVVSRGEAAALVDTEETFEGFTVGYVELPGALRIEARLTEPDPTKLRIGQEMELRIIPLGRTKDGDTTMIYAFAPVQEEASA